MMREYHVRICEGLGVKFPGPTRQYEPSRWRDGTSGDVVTVTITDRGPYVKGRCIDLSKASARALGAGLARVSVVPVVSD